MWRILNRHNGTFVDAERMEILLILTDYQKKSMIGR